ncbi:glycoside hydrolase family 95 protein [Streptomyces sp. DSM 41602]|uniref:Glycoside hydrolase family 95 protein n=2 Tax=Streptomyces antimycoticus TaxID=68175 RepID=A0ABD5JAA4_9ACTN|nr:glycoside hydrolase family 95 protein [Streptomyces sp. DSM 41602]
MTPDVPRRQFMALAATTTTGLAAAGLPAGTAHAAESAGREKADRPLALWYREPAADWLSALPLGNGRLGAMVFGATETERLQLNADTLWAGGPHSYDNHKGLAALPRIRQLVFDGKWPEAETLINSDFLGVPGGQAQYQTVGSLLLSLPTAGTVTGYRRELDLDSAVATTTYTRDGVTFTREAFASAPDRVVVVRLSASKKGALSFGATFESPLHTSLSSPDPLTAALDGTGDATGGVTGAVRFRALVRVLVEGGTTTSAGGTVTVRGADAATVLVAIGTTYVNWENANGDAAGQAAGHLNPAASRPYGRLRSRHVEDHRALFRRTSLDVGSSDAAALPTDERVSRFGSGGDPQLVELHFQYGRYLLIAASRPGTQPATLQGIWNDLTSPPWGSKYTININTEMNYWPAAPANLLECWEPVFALLDELAVAGRSTARTQYGADGWVTHHNTDAWRGTAPVDGAFWGMWPMGGAWMSMAIWEHYRYTRDTGKLRARYPVLKGAAQFFLDALVTDPATGALVTCPSVSPENAHHGGGGGSLCAGPTMDMQLLRDLFGAVASAADALGTDAAFRDQVLAARGRLAPMKVGARGQLQEWQQDWDAGAPEQQHRHVSHLYGLHPSNQISRTRTPELFTAARTTLVQRGDAGTGWSLAWKVNFWARLQEGDRSYKLLADLLTPERTAPNLFDLHPPFQIDGNFGACAGVTEWLLQSQHDELHLLPALPSQLPDGSVRGLLARGGFEVDISWRGGTLGEARLTARAGGPARLRTAKEVRVTSGDAPVPTTRPEPGVTAFTANAGATYLVRPV